jgi:transposase
LLPRSPRSRLARIGIEASGGYERGVVGYLRDKGFTVLVLQPIQVKAYARLHLHRAKNARLDAVLIAACAATIDRPRLAPDQRLAKLAQHLTFVEQIEEDIARYRVRIEHVDDPRLRRMMIADIARLRLRATKSKLIVL